MISFDEYGSKDNPTILMLHGAAALDTFCQQYDLADNYHLLVPHLFGAGQLADKPYDPDQMKQELLLLIDRFGQKKIGIIGYSLGAQIAIMLVCEVPERFDYAIFLSAWVNPNPKSIDTYCKLAGVSSKLLKWGGLVRLQAKYWHYNKEQTDRMVGYAKKITPQVYESFFAHTLDLSKYPVYISIEVPMLAICGCRELGDMKKSLHLLAQNSNCETMILAKASHDFPMRKAKVLNPILCEFIEQYA